jgi:hypothetical protein
MKKSTILWLIAFVLTILSAYYQRVTGPTYPASGEIKFLDESIHYKFDRSQSSLKDDIVKVIVKNNDIIGELHWRRLNSSDDWYIEPMNRNGDTLSASIPHQPKAGKVLYQVELKSEVETKIIPGEPVIIRFKGDVPAFILIPHIIFIFCAMLFSTRTGLEFFNKGEKYKSLTKITFLFIILGGMIFGPVTQLYAFDALWTGVPFGFDLTDNKTLIAFIGWLIALIAVYKSTKKDRWIIFASVITFIIFLIPHSLLGSELDYSKLKSNKNKIELNNKLKDSLAVEQKL